MCNNFAHLQQKYTLANFFRVLLLHFLVALHILLHIVDHIVAHCCTYCIELLHIVAHIVAHCCTYSCTLLHIVAHCCTHCCTYCCILLHILLHCSFAQITWCTVLLTCLHITIQWILQIFTYCWIAADFPPAYTAIVAHVRNNLPFADDVSIAIIVTNVSTVIIVIGIIVHHHHHQHLNQWCQLLGVQRDSASYFPFCWFESRVLSTGFEPESDTHRI